MSFTTHISERLLRREEYETLVSAGHLEGERVELLNGRIVTVSPQGSRHAWVVERLAEMLMPLIGEYSVRQEKPFAAGEDSEPEPDVAVTDRTSPDAHPSVAHLIVEVAATSRELDLGVKPVLYARSGCPRYWVVDLAERVLVDHTAPTADGYQHVTRHTGGALRVMGTRVDLDVLLG